jgi:predicted lipoprotein with Yx(FWY)xxD motif
MFNFLEKIMTRSLKLALLALSFCTVAGAATTMEKEGVLRDATGRTLYLFAKDEAGKSNCVDACLAKWPAFMAAADAKPAGDLTLVTRNDGSKQWALKDKPLYYFAGDGTVGDTKGDGLGGVWSVVRSNATAPTKSGSYSY